MADSCRYCEGKANELRRRVLANGSVQYTYQCLTCGAATSMPLSRVKIGRPDLLPQWDDSIQERYAKTATRQREQERADWFAEHSAYLKTPQWKARRARVLQRSGGLCEGCRELRATQVHHLTYEHWQAEFLFELVALCDGCHERIHADRTETQF